jgi:hypothetical protein
MSINSLNKEIDECIEDAWNKCDLLPNIQTNLSLKLNDHVYKFSIDFLNWVNINCYPDDNIHWWYVQYRGDELKTSKELLEIYKKEQRL